MISCMCGDGMPYPLPIATAGRAVILVTVLSAAGYAITLPAPAAAEDVQVALETPPQTHTVTGILTMLDIPVGKGVLKTDLDKPIFFRIARPDQFSRLSIGDRVTMQLDESGEVIKVIETLPAEVHEPPPLPR